MSTRVLCCSGSLEGGGSERQLWQLATGLDPQRFAVELYLLYRRGDYLQQLPPHMAVHDFQSCLLSPKLQRTTYLPGRIHRQQVAHLSAILRQRKIGVVYDRTFHMTLITAAACRRTGTPRVSVIVSPPSYDFSRSGERFGWFKKRLLARAYADPQQTCVAVSHSVAEDAARFYHIPLSRIGVIASPIDIAAVQNAAVQNAAVQNAAVQNAAVQNAANEVLSVGSGIPQVADPMLRWSVVGRLSPEKGQRTAIAAQAKLCAMRSHKAVELTLIGDGPDRQSLVELATQLGVQSSVRFVGQQSNPYPWMAACDLICIPSVYEGLPNVALEAMCLSIPLVASNCSGSLCELLGSRHGDSPQLGLTTLANQAVQVHDRGVLTEVGNVAALVTALLDRIDRPLPWLTRATEACRWLPSQHGIQPWLDHMQKLLEGRVVDRTAHQA